MVGLLRGNRRRGSVLGGWLIQVASWRWFLDQHPIAVVTWRLRCGRCRRAEREGAPARSTGSRPRYLGLVAGFGLLEAPRLGLSTPPSSPGHRGALMLAASAGRERSPEPMCRSTCSAPYVHRRHLLTLLLYAALGGAFFSCPST